MASYNKIILQVDELINFLKSKEIVAEYSSHLEHDYLISHEFYEAYTKNPTCNNSNEGRTALGGLHELYKWVWSVKDLDEFSKLKATVLTNFNEKNVYTDEDIEIGTMLNNFIHNRGANFENL